MRHVFIGLCIFTAACSGQPVSPTSPSEGAGVSSQAQASGARPVEVTFTKWITTYPALAGITEEGGVPGTFAGAVLSRDPFDNGTIVQLEAEYRVTADEPAHSFVVHLEGKQNNTTLKAVLNGRVTSGGWLAGAQVHVTYEVIVPATGTSCVPAAPVDRTCFQGTIRILRGSAN